MIIQYIVTQVFCVAFVLFRVVVMDKDQDLPYDLLMTKVDVRVGEFGLYNFYKMQVCVVNFKCNRVLFFLTSTCIVPNINIVSCHFCTTFSLCGVGAT